MLQINLDHSVEVKGHPCRTARVVNSPITIDRMSEESKKFEAKLAAAAGMQVDNHTCYEVKIIFTNKYLNIMCSDTTINIGGDIIIERW